MSMDPAVSAGLIDARLVDLNADLGEGFGAWRMADDEALLGVVTSANVACGFHAGDARTMRRVCELAAARGVRIGAHVGYRDLAGFGRRDIEVEPDELRDEVTYQIGALAGIARSCGTRVSYVKAHGALYNRAARDEIQGAALVEGVMAFDRDLPVLSLPGSVVLRLAAAAGLPTVTEAFPDRGYTAGGVLAPRSAPGGVLHEADVVAARAVRMARDGEVVAVTGEVVPLSARSLCLHGDTPGAVALAVATREALRAAGATVQAFT